MPFTPLHTGPGIVLKSLFSRYFSFTVFVVVQIMIDIEVMILIIQRKPYLHGFFHTFVGATIIVILMVIPGKFLSQWIKSIWNNAMVNVKSGKLVMPAHTSWLASFNGAMIGTYSHIVLDSLYHRDIRPFYPWFSENLLYGIVNPFSIEKICIMLGVAGILILLVKIRHKT